MAVNYTTPLHIANYMGASLITRKCNPSKLTVGQTATDSAKYKLSIVLSTIAIYSTKNNSIECISECNDDWTKEKTVVEDSLITLCRQA